MVNKESTGFIHLGHGCSTAVVQTPRNLYVVGSNPARYMAFSSSFYLFLLFFTSGVFFIRSLGEVNLYLCVVKAI